MVSSNTIIASLSHNTPKSMLGQKLLDIRVLDEFHSVYHKNRPYSFFGIRNIGHSLLTHIMYSNVAEIAVPISCGLFPASLNW